MESERKTMTISLLNSGLNNIEFTYVDNPDMKIVFYAGALSWGPEDSAIIVP